MTRELRPTHEPRTTEDSVIITIPVTLEGSGKSHFGSLLFLSTALLLLGSAPRLLNPTSTHVSPRQRNPEQTNLSIYRYVFIIEYIYR